MTPTLFLNDGRTIPAIGFGLWQVPAEDTARVVEDGLAAGFRLVDGAAIYGNEEGMGEGLRRAALPRDAVFVTTKVWNSEQGFDTTLRAAEASLARLGLDHVDLLLIHWPVPAQDRFVDTWKALIRLREEGRALSIGVSNFREGDIDRLVAETGVMPVLNQIELHPDLPQADLRAAHAARGIVTQSWTPLGGGRSFGSPQVQDIALRLGCTPAQVVLAWHLALGCSVIPRSTNAGRLAENLAATKVTLSGADLESLKALETGHRIGPDPSTFG